MKPRILDYKTCYKIAKRCSGRGDLKLKDSSVYKKAKAKGWLYIWFPESKHRIMNRKTCHALAKSCKTRTEFARLSYAAYSKSLHEGWLDKWIPKAHRPKSRITLETCKQAASELIAQGLVMLSDFKRVHPHMMTVAYRNGWANKLGLQNKKISYKLVGKRIRKYTIEQIVATAHTCTTLSNFIKKYPGMYQFIARHQLYDKIDFLKKSAGYSNGVMYDTVYSYEFPDTNTAYIGRTLDLTSRHQAHLHYDNDPIVQYASSIGVSVPKPLVIARFPIRTKDDRQGKMECRVIALYKALGWTLLNRAKGGGMGTAGFSKWTMAEITQTAKEFEYWADFSKAHHGMYTYICRRHMKRKFPWLKARKSSNGTWSTMPKEEAHGYAMQCGSRNEFRKKYSALSQRCAKNGWIEEWFPENTSAPRSVCQYTLDGELLGTYDSIASAARANGVKSSNISECLAGRQHALKNCVWAYDTTPVAEIKFPGQDYRLKSRPRKPVNQYTCGGKLIKRHASIVSAAESTGISFTGIESVLRGVSITAGGYVWAYSTTKLSDIRFPGRKYVSPSAKRPVIQYTTDGKFVKMFESISDAARNLHISSTSISNAVRGKHHTADGHVWAHPGNTTALPAPGTQELDF